MDEMEGWRIEIDKIDLMLVELLNRRGECAIEIGRIKKRSNREIYDPEREKNVIRNVQKAASGPLKKEAVGRLFERIIDESRRAEREAGVSEKSAPGSTAGARTAESPNRKNAKTGKKRTTKRLIPG